LGEKRLRALLDEVARVPHPETRWQGMPASTLALCYAGVSGPARYALLRACRWWSEVGRRTTAGLELLDAAELPNWMSM
jgi:hypothetical protein